ncbi:MAG: ABC transporter permease [Bryobacteraceae bacterium]
MLNDLRLALRLLRKRPGFAASAILVLALGIGASTAVFSVLYEALLKPLPYPRAGQIVFLHNSFPQSRLSLAGVSSVDYAEIRPHTELFSETGIYYFNDLTLTGAGAARHVDPVNASAGLFRVLDVKARLGRTIAEEDDRYGAPKVALLSDALWRSAFNADPQILGRAIQLDGEPHTIIGVMPREFQFPYAATELWIPVARKPVEWSEMGRSDKWLQMIARLAPGVTAKQADSALAALSHGLAQRYPSFYPQSSGWRLTMQPLVEEQTKAIRVWLALAFGAVLCVLLIACSNVSALLLVRSTERAGELAVRAALGAARSRIVRQILTETAVLAFFGCFGGILLAVWAVDLSDRYGPLAQGARVEIWTVVFAIGMALLSTIAGGLLPALLSARLSLEQALKSGMTRTSTRGSRSRYLLVAGQIAVAFTLVFSAILLSRSFIKLLQVPPGFSPARLWSGSVALPRKQYRTEDASLRFFQRLEESIAAMPGVESAAAVTSPPFNPSGMLTVNVYFPGRPEPANQPKAQIASALSGYFETMKIPLRSGRTFTPQDLVNGHRVVIIDEEFARAYFRNEDPLGKLVGVGGERDTPSSVIGVVANVENTQLGGPHQPQIYAPDPEELSSAMYLVVRLKNDEDIASAVRSQVAKLDRNVALFDVATMDRRIARSLKVRRYIAFLLNGFALTGLLLAAFGLYGSLSHMVELRRREIGIRLALGAVWQDLVRMIAVQGGSVAAAGMMIGIIGAGFAGRLLRSRLFGVQDDAATWAAVLGLFALAAFLAAWLPARRAVQIEPMEALREE